MTVLPATAPSRPTAPPTPASPEAPDLAADLGPTLALGALTVVSALAFTRVFTTAGWAAPVFVTAAGAHFLAWWLRRRRIPVGVALLASVVVVALAGCYLVLPGDLTWGLPLGHTYHAIGNALQRAGTGMRDDITPVRAMPGYSLLVVWGTGAGALIADVLAFRLRAPLQALAPAFALFLTASAIGTSHGRLWTVGVEVAAMAAFLLVERLSSEGRGATWLGGRHSGTYRTAVRAGALSAAAAVLAAVSLTPSVPQREGDGLLGWRNPPGANGTRVTPSPFDDLRTRLLDNPDTVVMTVQSNAPSYWRLTSLSDFDGTVWSSNDSYESAGGRLPGVSNAPGTTQVEERFHIDALDSIWLPTGFNPEAVHHVAGVSWDPTSGSLISASATSNGETYTLQASEELSALSPSVLGAAPAVDASNTPTGELALPSTIPARIAQLAHTITAGDTTEYAKAYALEQYFHKAPFVYTLSPISDDSTNALSDFLFSTHQGYCQQFAGAYAVLAREVGLPTRIAVGFQTGTESNGVYTVTDQDAHAWPEVWFPGVGWVPFEPTPGRQVPGASYTGPTSSPQTLPTVTVPATTAVSPSVTSRPVLPRDHAPTPASAPAVTGAHHHTGTWTVLGLVVAGLALVVGGWAAVVAGIRRWRWRRRRTGGQRFGDTGDALSPGRIPPANVSVPDPAARRRVLVAWAETAEMLSWWRLRRRSTETVMEFVQRAEGPLGGLGSADGPRHELRELAGLVQLAEFSGVELSETNAERAELLARHLIAALRRAAPRGRRIEHLVDPRSPVLVDVSPAGAGGVTSPGLRAHRQAGWP